MDFEKTFGRYINNLNYLGAKRLNDLLAEAKTNITTDQFRLLAQLWKNDGQCQQALAKNIGRDRASVTRMVDILEKQHIITRIPDNDDRRINLIYLTKTGKALEDKAAVCAQKVLDEMTKNFSKEEVKNFELLLMKAIGNLQKKN